MQITFYNLYKINCKLFSFFFRTAKCIFLFIALICEHTFFCFSSVFSLLHRGTVPNTMCPHYNHIYWLKYRILYYEYIEVVFIWYGIEYGQTKYKYKQEKRRKIQIAEKGTTNRQCVIWLRPREYFENLIRNNLTTSIKTTWWHWWRRHCYATQKFTLKLKVNV